MKKPIKLYVILMILSLTSIYKQNYFIGASIFALFSLAIQGLTFDIKINNK